MITVPDFSPRYPETEAQRKAVVSHYLLGGRVCHKLTDHSRLTWRYMPVSSQLNRTLPPIPYLRLTKLSQEARCI